MASLLASNPPLKHLSPCGELGGGEAVLAKAGAELTCALELCHGVKVG